MNDHDEHDPAGLDRWLFGCVVGACVLAVVLGLVGVFS